MFHTTLASATDIQNWASRIDARAQLSHVVRRLIQHSTPDLTRLGIRAGEGIQSRGETLVLGDNLLAVRGVGAVRSIDSDAAGSLRTLVLGMLMVVGSLMFLMDMIQTGLSVNRLLDLLTNPDDVARIERKQSDKPGVV